jgi:hypothetical protein
MLTLSIPNPDANIGHVSHPCWDGPALVRCQRLSGDATRALITQIAGRLRWISPYLLIINRDLLGVTLLISITIMIFEIVIDGLIDIIWYNNNH